MYPAKFVEKGVFTLHEKAGYNSGFHFHREAMQTTLTKDISLDNSISLKQVYQRYEANARAGKRATIITTGPGIIEQPAGRLKQPSTDPVTR